ncbi:hypothetical protein P175DRAFT_0534607 [Aspergillus ochraceoroseus IBT 24754]|uniref:Uncharacterized protein n=1 Tax=Aspergillus ochraceoroseus IBT 24754 TaxID=1392256 RepID=A0A2T5LRB7_9EURO|nr:uncharacterized protein P175DRAFT_0534607 [Aspergillus ochraceoroseus IBT 24754]PTU18830.1 hypothetical protein P175DRAFT_0534607 [Aspergillus ochraceoroseus IBT 24754]
MRAGYDSLTRSAGCWDGGGSRPLLIENYYARRFQCAVLELAEGQERRKKVMAPNGSGRTLATSTISIRESMTGHAICEAKRFNELNESEPGTAFQTVIGAAVPSYLCQNWGTSRAQIGPSICVKTDQTSQDDINDINSHYTDDHSRSAICI